VLRDVPPPVCLSRVDAAPPERYVLQHADDAPLLLARLGLRDGPAACLVEPLPPATQWLWQAVPGAEPLTAGLEMDAGVALLEGAAVAPASGVPEDVVALMEALAEGLGVETARYARLVMTEEGACVLDAGDGLDPRLDVAGLLEALVAGQSAAQVWLRARSGVVETVRNLDAARRLPAVRAVHSAVRPGERVGHAARRHERDRLGWVIAEGADGPEALARARHAAESVAIVTRQIL
jgi:hypothetical protein